ncbi:hypothetical protein IQ13_1038 [Lacibacter cauensis]|uniref:Apea-like HEPN domain-containing protein n=1 Tax=Lacibacter cauensis TaxID=510947 RepID=A0A562SX63_9BACT|nr:HEPN domain-containing protein [Lacibacter cauensis]TWI85869.1 hypothetical protein IQ13_1038 [Lacibacter cauensis]
MKIGIDIEFYEPNLPNEVREGLLFIDQDGKDYFEYNGSMKDWIKSYKVIYATAVATNEKYTFINCYFSQSSSSRCKFVINELYEGDFVSEATEKNCIEAEVRITGLTNWINHPRIKPEITFSTSEQSKVILKEFFTRTFQISEHTQLELCEFCGENYSRNQTILQNLSFVKLKNSKPTSRLEMYHIATAFSKLLSLFSDDVPRFTYLQFSFTSKKQVISLSTKGVTEPDNNDTLLSYDKLELYWPKILETYYSKRDKYVKVIDLLIASIKNNTAEISFLNITTAFEVFHKYFYEKENEALRKVLLSELSEVGLVNRPTKRWEQIIRYHHLFKIIEGIDFFKQNFQNPLKTIDLIRESRNYYTHYHETEKEIWTPNRLLYANKALRQLLKGVILKELQLPDHLINKLLSNRAAVFYQDYENNEYSLHFTGAASAKRSL